MQLTNKLHSPFERLDAFVSEGRPLKKGCNVTQCCPTPGTTKVRARTASLQLELINQLQVAPPLPLHVAKVLGKGNAGN